MLKIPNSTPCQKKKKKKEKITNDIANLLPVVSKEVEKITVVILWFPNCVEGLHETF